MGWVQAIFKILMDLERRTFGCDAKPPGHLAYVDWFTKLGKKDDASGMFPIAYSKLGSGQQDSAIIEVASIVRTCHVFLVFGRHVRRDWSSDNVLDRYNNFYLSNWKDKLTYQSIY